MELSGLVPLRPSYHYCYRGLERLQVFAILVPVSSCVCEPGVWREGYTYSSMSISNRCTSYYMHSKLSECAKCAIFDQPVWIFSNCFLVCHSSLGKEEAKTTLKHTHAHAHTHTHTLHISYMHNVGVVHIVHCTVCQCTCVWKYMCLAH